MYHNMYKPITSTSCPPEQGHSISDYMLYTGFHDDKAKATILDVFSTVLLKITPPPPPHRDGISYPQ